MKWFIHIPEEGDWKINYNGTSEIEAREVYLTWADRKKLPKGATIYSPKKVQPVGKLKLVKVKADDVLEADTKVRTTNGYEGFIVETKKELDQFDSPISVFIVELTHKYIDKKFRPLKKTITKRFNYSFLNCLVRKHAGYGM